MPDPFLSEYCFEREYVSSQRVGEFYGAKVWREGNFVFLQCGDQQQRTLLARIDCYGYPADLPEVTFLDPATMKPSTEKKFWPPGLSPIKSSRGFGICLAGTRAYEEHHRGDRTRYSLSSLVEILILCCHGNRQRLSYSYGTKK